MIDENMSIKSIRLSLLLLSYLLPPQEQDGIPSTSFVQKMHLSELEQLAFFLSSCSMCMRMLKEIEMLGGWWWTVRHISRRMGTVTTCHLNVFRVFFFDLLPQQTTRSDFELQGLATLILLARGAICEYIV
ncbi:unnamed protein product [Amoebophrya sp. A25]|nr:unnamed protein product [Amoebophrya sp. A25]|eukprot:GSA25T00011843001.1